MIRFNTIDRRGRVPRSALLLSIVLLVAGAALFLVSRQSPNDQVMGGPILDLQNTSIDGFLFTHRGAQFRFEQNEAGYWTLRGGISDFLDQTSVEKFLNDLQAAQGGRLLPGTDIEDRRYEFNGPDALRLTVFTKDGRRQKLAVGVVNPVTGHYYASGVERPGCFPVTEIVRNRLVALPASLQLSSLLPHFDRKLISRAELWYGDELQILQRFDGRWWLRQPESGLASLGQDAKAYHQVYSDRVIHRDDETWLLALEEISNQVVYESSEIIINEFPVQRDALSRLQEWELDPPWRRVVLKGAGINPDSTEAASDLLQISLGNALEDGRVPVLRRGNVLMTEGEALNRLNGPLGDFLDVGALSFLVAECDSLVASREGTLVLKGFRGEAPTVLSGLQKRPTVESWRTLYPARSQRAELRDLSYEGLIRNLIVNLDRLEILKLFHPMNDPEVLAEKEQVIFEVYGPGSKTHKLVFGFLVPENMSEKPVATTDGIPPLGLWVPDTGQLLQVPGHILVTLRNQAIALK